MNRLPVLLVALLVSACAPVLDGTPTWPGATLDRAVLTEADFPAGVRYSRLVEDPGRADGADAPPSMATMPPGCSDGLTKVIADSAERGPGSAAKYDAVYDGARIAMTVLSWPLDLPALERTADRCATFEVFFDESSPGIPMTTTRMPVADEDGADALVYQQTMTLGGERSSVYMAFANVGSMATFGLVTGEPNSDIAVKASLPQTFLDVVGLQIDRLRGL
ncbi:hypothetical protein [[Mycobacterium] wendilense]|uniref:DUF5642 domain-containing protein n=1 Tax=[Mycobacterium] wendilense TaxID=3064284 RepID=A0ABM9MFH0_9MYCO|nr:hypothetical protein [Mycolicibacterium sp. MU0050]CAJ1583906.1 hypothetical protein MU0050_002885 [Mycolicibacterium sp. MU0050]